MTSEGRKRGEGQGNGEEGYCHIVRHGRGAWAECFPLGQRLKTFRQTVIYDVEVAGQ